MYDAPTSEEIKTAMLNCTPVEYNGIVYARISAYIYRITRNNSNAKYTPCMQLELEACVANSVTIAAPDKIKILNGEGGGLV